ncbi:hypothetical protein VPNG_04725 [Cytospora leucostoma]|uniref:Myb-like domain-containing protein n=1 Tax=Cytospora leucostoma TaxID=1230097 RepID=A0A423XAE6_9PEZI|nr:hypothetical protein VPNG_04725 [Cytospora leucostoma]
MENTPTKGAAFKWTAEAERDLFAACLVVAGEPKGATLKNAMDLLNEHFGERFTQKAASHRLQHLQKLKRKEGKTAGSDEATPKKATATPKKAGATPKKRGKATEDDADTESPSTKKRRGKGSAKKSLPEAEDQDDEEEKVLRVKKEEQ